MQLDHDAREAFHPANIASEKVTLASFDVNLVDERIRALLVHFLKDAVRIDDLNGLISLFSNPVSTVGSTLQVRCSRSASNTALE